MVFMPKYQRKVMYSQVEKEIVQTALSEQAPTVILRNHFCMAELFTKNHCIKEAKNL